MHGGQIRVDELRMYYESQGLRVFCSGIFTNEFPGSYPNYIPPPNHWNPDWGWEHRDYMLDALIYKCTKESTKYAKEVISKLPSPPNLIHVEHPWLFPLAEQIKLHFKSTPRIVYGSANIEHELKYSITRAKCGEFFAKKYSADVKEMEEDAISRSDACIAVTAKDLQYILDVSPGKNAVIAGNGASKPKINPSAVPEVLSLTAKKRYALFIGSGHPPNIDGFFSLLGDHSGLLAGDHRLVVAGGVGDGIRCDRRFNRLSFKNRIVITGMVEKHMLDTLICKSHQILLPIRQGGGSNLKTAEALLSGKFIVATDMAMRGFEPWANCPRVKVCNDRISFIKSAMLNFDKRAPLPALNDNVQENESSLLWDSTLSSISSIFNQEVER